MYICANCKAPQEDDDPPYWNLADEPVCKKCGDAFKKSLRDEATADKLVPPKSIQELS